MPSGKNVDFAHLFNGIIFPNILNGTEQLFSVTFSARIPLFLFVYAFICILYSCSLIQNLKQLLFFRC